MSYQPSEQVKNVQGILEAFERKKATVARLRGNLLSLETKYEPESKRIREETGRKLKDIREKFEAMTAAVERDAELSERAMQDELDLANGALYNETHALDQIRLQLEAELKKMAALPEMKRVSPIDLEPSIDVGSR